MALIYFFDKLSAEPKLNIQGKARYVTKIGAIMTILSYCLILSLAIYLFVKFVQGQGVNVVYYTRTDESKYFMNLTESPFLFLIRDSSEKEVDPRILNTTLDLHVVNFKDSYSKKIPLKSQKFSSKFFPKSKALDFLKKPDYINYISFYESFWVPVIENFNFSLLYDENLSSSIILTVKTCQNSTAFNNCYSDSFIKKYLEENRIKITYQLSTNPLYIFDYYNPLEEVLISRDFEFKTDLEYIYNDKYKMIFFDSDAGLFLEDVISRTGYKYDTEFSDNSVALVKTENPDYLKIIIEINNLQADYYLRSYPKLQSLIAEVEGISNWVFYVATFISTFFSEKPMNLAVFNSTVKVKKTKISKISKISIISRPNFNQTRNDSTLPNFKELKIENSVTSSNNNRSYIPSSKKVLNPLHPSIRKKLSYSYYELIFPTCAIKNINKRILLEKALKFNDKVLSVEKIVENVLETNKLKRFIFEQTNLDLYDSIEMFNRNDSFLKFWLKKKDSDDDIKDLNETVLKLEDTNDYMSRKLFCFFNLHKNS
jgi:hypothetical protein